jgi:uncharacterized membrane protein
MTNFVVADFFCRMGASAFWTLLIGSGMVSAWVENHKKAAAMHRSAIETGAYNVGITIFAGAALWFAITVTFQMP